FDAFGRTFDLRLEPNHRLLSYAARGALTGAAQVYRGNVAGMADSWSRIVIAGGVPRGLIKAGSELYAIEARSGSGGAVIYRLQDLYVPPGSVSCGTTSGNAADLYGNLVGELGKTAAGGSAKAGAVSQISLAAIGDYELFGTEGPGSEVAILTRLNNVDGIFSEQLGVQIYVADIRIFSSPSDPFSDTADPRALLDELASYRASSASQRSQALTHLYTGRKLAGSTVGIAYNDTLCQPTWGAGLTRLGGNVTFDSLVEAHEIGHNFGAPHDGEAGSPCAAVAGQFLMSPTINGSDQFSQCSIQQMRPSIDAAQCVVPVPRMDAGIALSGDPPSAVLGEIATIELDVTNVGTAGATGVGVIITLPGNASYSSSSAPQGTCTQGAGTVSCDIGSIPAGSDRVVTLELTAADVGSAGFTATVEADADDDPANNEVTAEFRVQAAADPGSGASSAPVAAASSGGGGGASGLLWLAVLVTMALRRLRKSRGPRPLP
ncbi:MAG TPA: zinc-dependent metalloprotease family protein, partial [Woeseiaceae bacterium]|nr:zinc-dependent metalloprotease family protein [Woeseiaceae bacterium]